MWSRDLCIPRSIGLSKKAGSRRVGTYTRLVEKRSFTSSRALDENNSRPKKRAGIGCASRLRKSDRPHKAQRGVSHKKAQKHIRKKQARIRNRQARIRKRRQAKEQAGEHKEDAKKEAVKK